MKFFSADTRNAHEVLNFKVFKIHKMYHKSFEIAEYTKGKFLKLQFTLIEVTTPKNVLVNIITFTSFRCSQLNLVVCKEIVKISIVEMFENEIF